MNTDTLNAITAIVGKLPSSDIKALELQKARQILDSSGLDGLAAHYESRGYTLTEDDRTKLGASLGAGQPRSGSKPLSASSASNDDTIVTSADANTLAEAAVSAGVIDKANRSELAAYLTGRSRGKARSFLQRLATTKG